MIASGVKRFLVGRPLATAVARHERLSKTRALAVLASDNISIVAYATEEILLVLMVAGAAALTLSVPVALAVALVVGIVITSYRQTVIAYPEGASGYIVSKDNFGPIAGLTAGASLLTDYTLTVAVSVSAGVAAITSAFPALYPHRIALGVLFVAALAVANLRGVRDTGRLFALPTYFFIAGFVALIVVGLVRYLWEGPPIPVASAVPPADVALGVSAFLLLRAFSSGAVALTGIEAVSDAIKVFKPPEVRNARITLLWIGIITSVLFVGVTILAAMYAIVPREEETVVSQLARQILGTGAGYYYVQIISTMILVLAANTAFADFPRLAYFMARDGFLPRQFANRGDRLVFSNGIIILALAAAILLVIFDGSTHALIPLYAVGVFTTFTLSQSSMVRRWFRDRGDPRWRWRATVNGLGAATTGLVTVVIAVSKFVHGAWVVVVLIPALITIFYTIYRHYQTTAAQLSLEGYPGPVAMEHSVLVLVGDLHRGVVEALQYAKTLSPAAKAIYVELDPERTRRLEERWVAHGLGVPLIVLTSPYRSLITPLLDYLNHLQADGKHWVTIVLPEFLPARWWQHLLHNQTALLIKGALLFRKHVVVTDVPYHLR